MVIHEVFWPRQPRIEIQLPGVAPAIQQVFYQGSDVHIIRNGASTGNLKDHLYIRHDSNQISSIDSALSKGLISKIEFIPQLIHGNSYNSTHPNVTGYIPYLAYGVSIHTYTGSVSASQITDADHLKHFNFILTAQITDTLANIYTTKIRIHVHDLIRNAWITPSTLTIPAGLKSRFSIFAEFSDGLIGDITNHPGISWAAPNPNWSIDEANGVFTPVFDATLPSNNTVAIDAILKPNSLFNQTGNPVAIASANIIISDSWSSPAEPMSRPYAEWIAGPGKGKINDVTNFLIIPEGCRASDKDNAFKLVKNLRDNMKTKHSKSPWDHLHKEVNFWMLFIPSKNGAITIKNELIKVLTYDAERSRKKYSGVHYSPIHSVPGTDQKRIKHLYQDGRITWEAVQTETKKTGWHSVYEFIMSADQVLKYPNNNFFGYWDWVIKDETKNVRDPARYHTTRPAALTSGDILLSTLVEKVGFPTPFDASASKATLTTTKWKKLYDDTMVVTDVEDHVFSLWKILAERRLPNELDTAIGTAFGIRPRADISIDKLAGAERLPNYSRVDRRFLDNALKGIKLGPDAVNDPTSNNWADSANPTTSNYWGQTLAQLGKDFSRVIIVSAKTKYGGVQLRLDNVSGDFIGYGILANLEDDPFLYPNSGAGRQINLRESTYPSKMNLTAFGTITHEITHSYDLGDEYGNKVTLQKSVTPFDLQLPVIKSLNLQKEKDMLVSAFDEGGNSLENNGQIDGDKIKWRWLRIANAGVLINPPQPSGGNFILSIKPGHEIGFKKDDNVYLRKEDIDNVVLLNQLPSPQFSSKLTIIDIDPSTKKIKVSGLSNPADYQGNSILVKLVEAKVKGKGNISSVQKKITGLKTYFEVQVNEANKGGSLIRIEANNANGYEEIIVEKVISDTELELVDPFTNNISNKEYEIIQRDPGSLVADSYKELLNFTIRMAINKNGRPMTTYPFTAIDLKIDGGAPQKGNGSQLKVDSTKNVFKLTRIRARNNNNIVGIYRNGQEYTHGIFHPTGYCHMRNNTNPITIKSLALVSGRNDWITTRNISRYCSVCRYVLVDKIDPSKHSKLENDKSSFYPEI